MSRNTGRKWLVTIINFYGMYLKFYDTYYRRENTVETLYFYSIHLLYLYSRTTAIYRHGEYRLDMALSRMTQRRLPVPM